MKKITLTISLLVLIFGCKSDIENQQSKDEIVRINVEEFFKANLNDPESYEFVELQLIDSVLFIDNINFRKEMFNGRMESAQSTVDSQTRYKEDFPSIYSEEDLLEAKKTFNENKNIVFSIDSVANVLGEKVNEVASYTYLFKARANNSFGAKILNSYYVQTTPELDVLNITDEKNKMFSAPNSFPGYNEIMNFK